jgi:hypothetical protein
VAFEVEFLEGGKEREAKADADSQHKCLKSRGRETESSEAEGKESHQEPVVPLRQYAVVLARRLTMFSLTAQSSSRTSSPSTKNFRS